MRVLIVIPSTSGGGAEFVAMQWRRYLLESGVDVSVALTSPESSTLPGVEPLAARGFVSQVRALRRVLRRERPDVVLALMPYWNVLSLVATRGSTGLRKLGARVVISGRNVDGPLATVQGTRFRLVQAMARLLYRRADAYIAISHPVAAEAISRYRVNPSRVWVVPNPAMGKRPRREHQHATRSETLTIVVPARLVAQKRPILALEVAEILTRQGIPTNVLYCGSGPLQNEVRSVAAAKGISAQFTGWVDEWFAALPPRSVVLLPSLVEGFGNVLIEAAASGVPSVASSRALGVADAIVPGLTGELVADDSAASFADAVRAADSQPVGDVTNWLKRFEPADSGARLLQVLTRVTRP
jgi:glycosyltransferase involved in cell wall biosynthesis